MNTSSRWCSILPRSSEVNRHFFSAGVCCGTDRLRPPGPDGDGRQEMGMEPVVIPSGNFWATTFNPWEDGEGNQLCFSNTQPSQMPTNNRQKDSPPDNIKRFSKPLSHMVVAAWLAILSSSSYTIMILPEAFFYIVVKVKCKNSPSKITWLVEPMLQSLSHLHLVSNKSNKSHYRHFHTSATKGYIFKHFFSVWVHCPW